MKNLLDIWWAKSKTLIHGSVEWQHWLMLCIDVT
jgi:hypothetical protein